MAAVHDFFANTKTFLDEQRLKSDGIGLFVVLCGV
jgi:hypothetical protein